MGDLCWKRHIDQVRLADGSLLDREQDEDTRDCFQQAAPLGQLTGVVRQDPDVPGRGTERQTVKEPRLEPTLRRSRRQRVTPTYLKDYCPK